MSDRHGTHKDRICLVCTEQPTVPGSSWNWHFTNHHNGKNQKAELEVHFKVVERPVISL